MPSRLDGAELAGRGRWRLGGNRVRHRWGIEDGLYIQHVYPDGSAAAAGLEPGDVVTKIDGNPADRADVITRLLLTKKAGDTVRITFVRDGTEHTVTATLVARPS